MPPTSARKHSAKTWKSVSSETDAPLNPKTKTAAEQPKLSRRGRQTRGSGVA